MRRTRTHKALWNFVRRALWMLVVLLAASILIANFGGESFSTLSFVKEAASALAEAAGEAFGDQG